MVMGRGSDTRMYSPRSESDKMYSSANEDETKYNPASPEYNEQKAEEKKRMEEEKKAKRGKIKHIKVRATQGLSGEESPAPIDDSNKRDDEREIGLAGGPAGSRGTLLDLATGAKSGTGSAMSSPLPIAMSEPMEDAWSTLLKASLEDLIQERDKLLESGLKQEAKQFDYVIQQMLQPQQREQQILQNIATPTARMLMPDLDEADLQTLATEMMYEGKQNPDYIEMQRRMGDYDPQMKQQFMRNVSRMSRQMPKIQQQQEQAQQSLRNLQMSDPSKFFADEEIMASEPMEDAWGDILKRETERTIASRRKQEARQMFRPSTGQFNRPPGGMSPEGATMRRFKSHMRGIKGGKKTGLMLPHLAVEMSHRGIATKQPMSKDPQRYRQYQAQSEARKILGNVRTTFSPHARYAARSNVAGPTGAGRLSGLLPSQRGMMRQPSLHPVRISRPRMPRMFPPTPPTPPMMPQMQSSVPSVPAMPDSSSIMMSEERYQSEILKARNDLRRIELLNLMRRLIQAKEREARLKKAGSPSAFEEGAVPAHPAGVKPSDDEEPDGPTENTETDAKTFGLDPAGALISRRGHMG